VWWLASGFFGFWGFEEDVRGRREGGDKRGGDGWVGTGSYLRARGVDRVE
jgi:hypothetical protein